MAFTSIYGHLQAFMGIYKHFKRRSEGHSHDVLLRTRRLYRKNEKEREEYITPLFFFVMLVVYFFGQLPVSGCLAPGATALKFFPSLTDTPDTGTSRIQHKVNKDKQKERLLRPLMGGQRQTTTYMSLYVALANRWLIERTCNRKNANGKTKLEKLTLPNIFPSPISPVFASSIMVSITDSTCENQVLRSIQDIYRVVVRASSTPNISFKHTTGDCVNVQPM